MSQQSQRQKGDIEDEAWELDSGGSTRSASNASSRGTFAKLAPSRTSPISLPSMSLDDSGSDSENDSESEGETKILASFRPLGYQSSQKPGPIPVQLLATLPPPEAAPKGLQGQVSYLRQENKLLREALTKLQQEAEDVSARQAQGEVQNVDFAHLLELAREFGDLCSSQEALAEGEGDAACNFCISTPRGENHLTPVEGDEDDADAKLRSDLEFSRREVARLEAMVAEREANRRARHLGKLDS